MNDIKIRQVEGGYIITTKQGSEKVVTSTEKLFKYLLLVFEGLSDTFSGDSFGLVIINRNTVTEKEE